MHFKIELHAKTDCPCVKCGFVYILQSPAIKFNLSKEIHIKYPIKSVTFSVKSNKNNELENLSRIFST